MHTSGTSILIYFEMSRSGMHNSKPNFTKLTYRSSNLVLVSLRAFLLSAASRKASLLMTALSRATSTEYLGKKKERHQTDQLSIIDLYIVRWQYNFFLTF